MDGAEIQIVRDPSGGVAAIAFTELSKVYRLSDGREISDIFQDKAREEIGQGGVQVDQVVVQPRVRVYASPPLMAYIAGSPGGLRMASADMEQLLRRIGIQLDPWPEPDYVRSASNMVFVGTPWLLVLKPLGRYSDTQCPIDLQGPSQAGAPASPSAGEHLGGDERH